MSSRGFSKFVAVVGIASSLACEKSNPASPSAATVSPTAASTDARTGVTTAAPQPVSPANGARINFGAQPVVLVITNGLSTAQSGATYTFEVATDTAFASKVYSKENVPEGSGGRTSLTIDRLGADKTYYWRAATKAGSAAGATSEVRSFTIGPPVIIQTPVPISPGPNATASVPVVLTVGNSDRSGPAGAISYQFDLSTSDSFASLVFSTTVGEQPGQTSAVVTSTLAADAIYFWRARAIDPANDVNTPFSAALPFKAETFDATKAIFHDNPPDVGFWDVGATITSIEFTDSAMLVDFSRREGPDRWPDVPFGSGSIQYTLGMCLNLGGQWHCSAVVQFWAGRELTASGVPSDFHRSWWYNAARWGPMTGYQPADGEIVGVFVAAGNLRQANYSGASCPRVCERSNIVLLPFANHGGVSYPFSTGGMRRTGFVVNPQSKGRR